MDKKSEWKQEEFVKSRDKMGDINASRVLFLFGNFISVN